jgi:DoxX-like family
MRSRRLIVRGRRFVVSGNVGLCQLLTSRQEIAHQRRSHLSATTGPHYCVVMIAEVIVTALLAVLFTFSSLIKLVGVRQSLAIRDHLGVKPMQWRVVGLLELTGVVGVLAGLAWAPIGVAAAVGLALLLLGAITFHVRAADSTADMAPAVIGLGLAVATAILQAA